MAFEKLGVFYLGRPYDVAKKAPLEGLVLYNSKDLVTHAVCIGMTGSGKTGLCVCVLEEAALDGIPAIVIDPKGDITNLLLTFPDLKPADFAPWVNEDDAARKGLSVQDYAKQQAEQWSAGLKTWGEDGERIRRLREAADFVIYTPGSSAGLPISILRSFSAPSAAILNDEELLQERVTTTVSSLLGLMGIEADPLQSREFILISTLMIDAWKKGEDLDLVKLVQRIRSPPIKRVGALDLESFYPSKDRFVLATKTNNLLAAPGFQLWLQGEPIDIGQLTHTQKGKPRVPIFYIAHLSDAERMFFVSLLLNEVVGWMRAQSGTTSLRTLLYIDEVFGYLPPVANPPSKLPLMTLLKQARAFGLGLVLATQNPVDLDYKALSNAGTWWIGRLQTERDKARVLEALDSVTVSTSGKVTLATFDRTLSSLEKRVFLMHDVNLDAPVVFETRWAMSYLRGPLTRDQIKTLMDPIKTLTARAAPVTMPAEAPKVSAALAPAATTERPVLPPDVPQYFLPMTGGTPTGQKAPVLQPMILGAAQVHFANAKASIDFTKDIMFLAPVTNEPVPVRWDQAKEVRVNISNLTTEAPEGVAYAELPPAAFRSKNYGLWQRDFAGWLATTQELQILRRPSFGEYSRAGEPERDFRVRLQLTSKEERDQFADDLHKKYASKFSTLDNRIGRAQKVLKQQQAQSRAQAFDTVATLGSALLRSFIGGRRKSLTTAIGRSYKESGDANAAKAEVKRLEEERDNLEKQFEEEIREREKKTDPVTEPLEKISISPTRSDVTVRLLALTWVPA